MVAIFPVVLALATVTSGFATIVPISKHAGAIKADSYIMLVLFFCTIYTGAQFDIASSCFFIVPASHRKLKDSVVKSSHIAHLLSIIGSQDSKVVYKYDQVFHGYAATLKVPILDVVRKSSDVDYILEDGIYTVPHE